MMMKSYPLTHLWCKYFRKWPTPEVLGEITEMIVRDAKEPEKSKEAAFQVIKIQT